MSLGNVTILTKNTEFQNNTSVSIENKIVEKEVDLVTPLSKNNLDPNSLQTKEDLNSNFNLTTKIKSAKPTNNKFSLSTTQRIPRIYLKKTVNSGDMLEDLVSAIATSLENAVIIFDRKLKRQLSPPLMKLLKYNLIKKERRIKNIKRRRKLKLHLEEDNSVTFENITQENLSDNLTENFNEETSLKSKIICFEE